MVRFTMDQKPSPFPLAAHIGFVDLDVAVQAIVTVNVRHVLADFVAHAPCRLVGDAKRALQFLRGHAVARRREHVHRVKPLLERRVRALERRALHRVNVVAAPRASISGQSREAGEPARPAALWAGNGFPEARPHQMLKASIVCRESDEKVFDRQSFHGRALYSPKYRAIDYVRQRDKRAYWGVFRGKGQNKLGKILMQVREEIRTQKENQ